METLVGVGIGMVITIVTFSIKSYINDKIAKKEFRVANLGKQEKSNIESKKNNYKTEKEENLKLRKLKSKIKGEEYEKLISEHYRKQGYKVIENGKIQGKKDGGIDIIAKKKNELILIQCKNWRKDGAYKITHNDLKTFLGNCTPYTENIDKNKIKVERLFITSADILDSSAKAYLSEMKYVKHLCIPC